MNKSYARISDHKKSLRSSALISERSSKIKLNKDKSSKQHYIPLSQAIIENPTSVEENRISVVQKFVNIIDILPKKFQLIDSLYLSNNNIQSINGIQQFTRLKSLSLANNEINDPNTVIYLQDLPMLEALTLNGNPFCKVPNYRDYVVSSIPTLRSFDGKVLSPQDRQKCEINIRAQNSMMEILTKNCCDLILLNFLGRKLDVHKELLIKDPRFSWNFTGFSPYKLQETYRLHEQYDIKQRGALRADLMDDINTIKQELSLGNDQNDAAFSELIIRQEQRIAELLLLAETKWKSMEQIFRKKLPDMQYQKKQEGVISVLSNRTSPYKSTRRKILKHENSSFDGRSRTEKTFFTSQQQQSGNKKSRVAEEKSSDRDLFQKLYDSASPVKSQQDQIHYEMSVLSFGSNPGLNSNKKGMKSEKSKVVFGSVGPSEGPLRTEDLGAKSSLSPYKTKLPAPSKNERRPSPTSHAEECCRKLHREFDHHYKRLEAISESKPKPYLKKSKSPKQTMRSPPQSNRLIDDLHQMLREKTREVESLANANVNLQEKLSYRGSGDQMHKQFEDQFEDKSPKEYQSGQGLRGHLIDRQAAGGHLKNTKYSTNVIVEDQELLAIQNTQNSNDNASVKKQPSSKVQSKTFDEAHEKGKEDIQDIKNQLHELSERNQHLEQERSYLEDTIRKLEDAESRASQYARDLESITIENQTMEAAELFYHRNLLKKWFTCLYNSTKVSQVLDKHLARRSQVQSSSLLYISFRKWHQYYLLNKIIRQKQEVSRSRLLLEKFKEWKQTTRQVAYIRERLRIKREVLLTIVFLQWKRYLAFQYRSLHQKRKAHVARTKKLLKKGFTGFKAFYRRCRYTLNEEKNLVRKYDAYYVFSRRKKAFNWWATWLREHHIPNRLNKQKAQQFMRRQLLRRAMDQMLKYHEINVEVLRAANLMATDKNQEKLANFFYLWRNGMRAYKRKKQALNQLKERYIMKRTVKKWKKAFLQAELTREYANYYKMGIKRKVFEWLKNRAFATKNLAKNAELVEFIANEHALQKYFQIWRSKYAAVLAQKQKQQQIETNVLSRIFKAWIEYCNTNKTKREKLTRLKQEIETQIIEIQAQVLAAWRSVSKKKNRNRNVIESMKAQRNLHTCRSVFNAWGKEVQAKMRRHIAELTQRYQSLEKDVKESEEALQEVDNEKALFSEKEEKYLEQLESLKKELEKKNIQINGNLKELTDYERKNKDLVDKLEEREILDRTIKVKSQTNLIDTEKISTEYESVIADLKKERDELARRLKMAEIQKTQEPKVTLDDKKKDEQRLREREINEVNELRQKLKNSIKMGNEFKLALEGKDAQIERLLVSIEEYRREVIYLRAEIGASQSQPDRSSELEIVIKKLEKENKELRYDLNRMKEGDEKQKKEISVLRTDIKEYEAETRNLEAKTLLSPEPTALGEITNQPKWTSSTNFTSPGSFASPKKAYGESTHRRSRVSSRSPTRENQPVFHNSSLETLSTISRNDFDSKSEELKKRVATLNNYLSDVSLESLGRSRISDMDPISTRSRKAYEPKLFENERRKEKLSPGPIRIEDDEGERSLRSPRKTVNKYEKTINKIFTSPERQKEGEISSMRRDTFAIYSEPGDSAPNEILTARRSTRENIEQRIKRLNECLQEDIAKARIRINDPNKY